MGIHSSAGTTIGIGTADVATSLAEFQAETYVDIANLIDAGETGSESEIITTLFIDKRYARKQKSVRDNGVLTLIVGRDSEDPGYQALVAAEKTDHAYNFCVTLNDAPATGDDPTPSKFYFAALVASARTQVGTAGNIVQTTFALAITDEVHEQAADEGDE